MQYNFLGRTGLRVSALSLGTMTFGGSGSAFFEGVGGTDQKEATAIVHVALDHGVNLFDTADVYSRGVSEQMLGQALRGRRDQALIATKVHGRMSDEANDLGQSRHHILQSCEASLRRLGVDHIDLYQLHGYDAYTDWEESLDALTELVRQGKIRYIGCSNLSAWHLMKALSVSERRGFSRFAVLQANYSLVAREAEHELLPLCEDQNLGFLVWSPLAGGYLSGKYPAQGEATTPGRRAAVGDPGTIDPDVAAAVLAAAEEIAKAHSATPAQVALNYLLAKPGVTSVLVGARSLHQAEDNFGALTWSLTREEVAALDAASARPLPYPYWHQRQHNGRRYARA
ncbi:aldo/keto reductase [Streptomyces sp. CG1]|uniref:aldo/keto reductase n=1 Tax=Streptomyces sp. CG1 TaxID=1287523 RepID=UPI0034E2A02C